MRKLVWGNGITTVIFIWQAYWLSQMTSPAKAASIVVLEAIFLGFFAVWLWEGFDDLDWRDALCVLVGSIVMQTLLYMAIRDGDDDAESLTHRSAEAGMFAGINLPMLVFFFCFSRTQWPMGGLLTLAFTVWLTQMYVATAAPEKKTLPKWSST